MARDLSAFLSFSSHRGPAVQYQRLGLRALADEARIFAGFNFPRGAGRESEAARTFAPLIDPEAMCLCRFASRTQGLAVAPGNPLRILHPDFARRPSCRPRCRYRDRSPFERFVCSGGSGSGRIAPRFDGGVASRRRDGRRCRTCGRGPLRRKRCTAGRRRLSAFDR